MYLTAQPFASFLVDEFYSFAEWSEDSFLFIREASSVDLKRLVMYRSDVISRNVPFVVKVTGLM